MVQKYYVTKTRDIKLLRKTFKQFIISETIWDVLVIFGRARGGNTHQRFVYTQ